MYTNAHVIYKACNKCSKNKAEKRKERERYVRMYICIIITFNLIIHV